MAEGLAGAALALFIGWASGISVYLTVALLGLGGRMGLLDLPGSLDALTHPAVIGVAFFLFAIEFLADKIPFVDSAWDAVHTAVKPTGAFAVALLAGSEHGAVAQTVYALVSGAIALDVHAMKAGARTLINASPEPFSNVAASLAEQSSVLVVFWLCVNHPFWAALIMILTVAGSFFVLAALWRLLRGRRGGPPGDSSGLLNRRVV